MPVSEDSKISAERILIGVAWQFGSTIALALVVRLLMEILGVSWITAVLILFVIAFVFVVLHGHIRAQSPLPDASTEVVQFRCASCAKPILFPDSRCNHGGARN